MDWQEFVGSVVTSVEMNAGKDVLVFHREGQSDIIASATGDCCSHSWFEHVEGLECLIGHKIIGAVERAMPEAQRDHPEHDCLQFYGWTLETARGRFDIEMRNSSNGYYGGSVALSSESALDTYDHAREIGELKTLALPKTDWETPEITENLPTISPRRISISL